MTLQWRNVLRYRTQTSGSTVLILRWHPEQPIRRVIRWRVQEPKRNTQVTQILILVYSAQEVTTKPIIVNSAYTSTTQLVFKGRNSLQPRKMTSSSSLSTLFFFSVPKRKEKKILAEHFTSMEHTKRTLIVLYILQYKPQQTRLIVWVTLTREFQHFSLDYSNRFGENGTGTFSLSLGSLLFIILVLRPLCVAAFYLLRLSVETTPWFLEVFV